MRTIRFWVDLVLFSAISIGVGIFISLLVSAPDMRLMAATFDSLEPDVLYVVDFEDHSILARTDGQGNLEVDIPEGLQKVAIGKVGN